MREKISRASLVLVDEDGRLNSAVAPHEEDYEKDEIPKIQSST